MSNLDWPPVYVDIEGKTHNWDDIVPPEHDEEEDEEDPITWRELAHEIADNWGGIEDFLDHQWLLQGGRPEPESGRTECPECGVELHPGMGGECDACGWMG